MYNNFDYEKSLEKIKSALYDIYESQEIIIGEEKNDDLRNKQVEKYIKVKDLAVKLVEDIQNLYKDNREINENNSISEAKPQINQESKQDELLKINDETDEENDDEDEKDDINEININENDNDEEELDDLPKFYLDSRNGDKPNFAYVPNSIFVKLKENGILELFDNRIYKQDDANKKGIIVRTDQFMKLSLSKDRQEGVLKEAKIYRIEQARKARKKLQEIE